MKLFLIKISFLNTEPDVIHYIIHTLSLFIKAKTAISIFSDIGKRN